MTLLAPVGLSLLAAAALAAALIVTQVGLRHMSAYAGATIGLTTSALLYWLAAPALLDLGRWDASALAIFAIVGAFYPALATILTYESNRVLGPTLTGTVSSTAPIFAIGLAALILDEALTPGVVGGGILIVASLVLVSWKRDAAVRPGWRLVLPLSGAAVRGLAQTLTKLGLLLWPSAFAATFIGYTVSSAVIWSIRIARGERANVGVTQPGAKWFIAAGLLNGIALLLMNQALHLGRVGVVAPVIALYPLITMFFSALFLKTEALGVRIFVAAVMAVAGVAVLVSG